MEEKKLTDEEIVKALEWCGTSITCKGCPKYGDEVFIDYHKCKRSLLAQSIDLIHRLQEHNGNQVRMRCDMQRKFDDLQTLCTEQKAEIERLKERNYWLESEHECQCEKSYFEGVEKGRGEAVKDTAKEIYSKVKNKSGAELSFLNDLALWIKERFGVAVEKWIKIDGVEVE